MDLRIINDLRRRYADVLVSLTDDDSLDPARRTQLADECHAAFARLDAVAAHHGL